MQPELHRQGEQLHLIFKCSPLFPQPLKHTLLGLLQLLPWRQHHPSIHLVPPPPPPVRAPLNWEPTQTVWSGCPHYGDTRKRTDRRHPLTSDQVRRVLLKSADATAARAAADEATWGPHHHHLQHRVNNRAATQQLATFNYASLG